MDSLFFKLVVGDGHHEITAFWPHLLQSTTQGTLLQDAISQQDTENNEISASVTTEFLPLNYAFVKSATCWQRSTKSSMALLV